MNMKGFIAIGDVPMNPKDWGIPNFQDVVAQCFAELIEHAEEKGLTPPIGGCDVRVCGEDGTGACLLASLPVKNFDADGVHWLLMGDN